MKLGVVQMDAPSGQVESNMSKVARYARQAAGEGCDAVVFPEMVDTGYNMAAISATASDWDGKPFQAVCSAALENKIHIICNISERDGGNIYNTTAVVDPSGRFVGKYRKMHLAAYPPLNEERCITPGDGPATVRINDIRMGLLICYDLRFPEMSRSLVLGGADVLILCSAWPFPRLRHLSTLIQARAIENQVYFAAANRVGTENGITFCGSSCIVDPYGVAAAAASEEKETLITADIDAGTMAEVRARMPVFSHRTETDKAPLV
ncbi:MAG: nitrilase-related carbon-nitrogen hydrolase [Desulfobacteraceae bacterium]